MLLLERIVATLSPVFSCFRETCPKGGLKIASKPLSKVVFFIFFFYSMPSAFCIWMCQTLLSSQCCKSKTCPPHPPPPFPSPTYFSEHSFFTKRIQSMLDVWKCLQRFHVVCFQCGLSVDSPAICTEIDLVFVSAAYTSLDKLYLQGHTWKLKSVWTNKN